MTWVELIVVFVVIIVLVALLLPAVQQAREVARRTQSRYNLKEIGLALHNYHDVFQVLPPGGIFGPDGTAFHSWMTSITPYLDASPFYSQIDLSQPWDHPEQLERFKTNYPCYRDPSISEQTTNDGLSLAHYAANEWLMHVNSSVSLRDVSNTANVFAVGNAYGHYQPFGYPWNWRDPRVPLGIDAWQFGRAGFDFTHVLFLDGHVEVVLNSDHTRSATWAGNQKLHPASDLTARPREDYHVPPAGYWQTVTLYRRQIGQFEWVYIHGRKDLSGNVARVELGGSFENDKHVGKGLEPGYLDDQARLLVSHPHIERVRVGQALTAKGLGALQDLPEMKTLSLSGAATGDTAVPILLKLQKLENLKLVDPQLSNSALEQFVQHESLRYLQLDFDWEATSSPLSPAVILDCHQLVPELQIVVRTFHGTLSQTGLRHLASTGATFGILKDQARNDHWWDRPADTIDAENLYEPAIGWRHEIFDTGTR